MNKKVITVNNETHSLTEWSKLLGYNTSYVSELKGKYGIDYVKVFISNCLSGNKTKRIVISSTERVGTTVNHFHILKDLGIKNNKHMFQVQCDICKQLLDMTYEGIKTTRSYEDCNHISLRIKDKRLSCIFHGMKQRCYNPQNPSYYRYGGRGVKICNNWLVRPCDFEDWALNNGYASDLTINRRNNDGNYEPQNCEWIPEPENKKWTSRTHKLAIGNICDSYDGWGRRLGYRDGHVISRWMKQYTYKETIDKIIDKLSEVNGI